MTGAILIGGQSRRMGRDKALMLRDGRRVLERSANLLRTHCDRVVLVARDETHAARMKLPAGLPIFFDNIPDKGPLGGLYTVLEKTKDDVLLLACDLPFLEGDLIAKLRKQFKAARAAAILPRTPAGKPGRWQLEPLCALWSRRCLRRARQAIECERLSLMRFAGTVHAKYINLAWPEAAQLRNINTAEEAQSSGELSFDIER